MVLAVSVCGLLLLLLLLLLLVRRSGVVVLRLRLLAVRVLCAGVCVGSRLLRGVGAARVLRGSGLGRLGGLIVALVVGVGGLGLQGSMGSGSMQSIHR